VTKFYRKRIDYHSKLLAQYETIKKFKILSKPFTVEDGEITPTLKLKRKNITSLYKIIIDRKMPYYILWCGEITKISTGERNAR